MTDNQSKFNPVEAIYTPQQVSFYGVTRTQEIKSLQSRGIRYPIAGMRDYIPPILPGEVVALIAQTSQYKSGFIDFWEHSLAEELVETGRADECIIHLSLEETIEEMSWRSLSHYSDESADLLARGIVQNPDRLLEASVKVAGIPIYRVADCLARPDSVANLHLSNLQKAIRSLVRGDVIGRPIRPAAIFLDYLQALPIDPEVKRSALEDQRRLQVRQDIYRIRDMSVEFSVPFIVAVQAKQSLNDNRSKLMMPGIYDGEESSAIGQRANRIIGQWLPKMTSPVGSILEYGSVSFAVAENLLFQKVLKQRGNLPSGRVFGLRIDYKGGSIGVDKAITSSASPRDDRQVYTGGD